MRSSEMYSSNSFIARLIVWRILVPVNFWRPPA